MSTDAVPTREPSAVSLAWRDFREALSLSWFWMSLAWNDIMQRYRGSMLGPFWITLTTAIFIAGLGPLYARLFNLNMQEYLPFMALGVTTWLFIVGTINESCNAFTESAHMMRQVRLPRLAILFRVIWRNMIAFLHNMPIYFVVIVAFGLPVGWHSLALIPGFILICLNLTWLGIVVAILCARFRDIAPIVGSILQIGFFITPVMWNYKMQRVDLWVVELNPFAAWIELIRAPMMGDDILPALLRMAIVTLVLGWVLAAILFARFRRQIIYWV